MAISLSRTSPLFSAAVTKTSGKSPVDVYKRQQQGEYKFDEKYWPDVPGMCKELADMGIRVMVSVWPVSYTHLDVYKRQGQDQRLPHQE